jgi:hypothetical protein
VDQPLARQSPSCAFSVNVSRESRPLIAGDRRNAVQSQSSHSDGPINSPRRYRGLNRRCALLTSCLHGLSSPCAPTSDTPSHAQPRPLVAQRLLPASVPLPSARQFDRRPRCLTHLHYVPDVLVSDVCALSRPQDAGRPGGGSAPARRGREILRSVERWRRRGAYLGTHPGHISP